MLVPLLILLPLAPLLLAKPLVQRSSKIDFASFSGCPTSSIPVPVPSGLTVPAGQNVSLITVGRGIQNYTCTNGTYVSAGALAK